MKILAREIHENALKMAAEYKRTEAALISAIQQVEEFRVYLEYGYGSLFEYVTKALGLSASSAYNFISVSRKAIEIPAIKTQIASGNLTVSKIRKVIPVINPQNQQNWIEKAQTLSQRELEIEVAKVCPQAPKPELVKVVSPDVRELRITVSAELYEKLKRVQAIEKAATLDETLETMVEAHLEKKDPVRRAERVIKKIKTPVLRQVSVKNSIHLRDRGKCTYVDSNGKRCGNERFVEIHHIVPRESGGDDSLENQTTLCSGHHRLTHALI